MKLGGMVECLLSDAVSSVDGIIGRCSVLEALSSQGVGNDIYLNEVSKIVDDFRNLDGNICGGSLHIVLDDFNFNDSDVTFCMEYALKEKDLAGYALAVLLKELSIEDRRRCIEKE